MLYLEEYREVGDTVDKVDALISTHKTYMEKAEVLLECFLLLYVKRLCNA